MHQDVLCWLCDNHPVHSILLILFDFVFFQYGKVTLFSCELLETPHQSAMMVW